MLALKNTMMQSQAKQWPPGASKARYIPYGGNSTQLTLALECSDTRQPPELCVREALVLLSHLSAVLVMQFGGPKASLGKHTYSVFQ